MWKGAPSGRAQPRGRPPAAARLAALGEAAAALAGVIRQWCGQDITDGWVLHLVRKWLSAGYTAADLREAIAAPPRGQLHRYRMASARRPRNVLLWRLSLHEDPLGRPWPPPSHVRQYRRNRLRQADAPLFEKSFAAPGDSGAVKAWLHTQLGTRQHLIRKGIPVSELYDRLNPPRLHNGADASNPKDLPLPAGTEILLGYIGIPGLAGAPDTPVIWARDQWNQYLDPDSPLYGGPDLRPCPIYVHDYPGDPAADAINAAAAAADLGWATDKGRIIWWDSEMLIDPGYCAGLNEELARLGFRLGKYGLWSTVNQNPIVNGGSWIAELQPRKPRVLPPDRVGQQWQFGLWDSDVFDHFVYENCGRGPRRARGLAASDG